LQVTEDNHCKITDYGASRIIDVNANMTGNIGTAAWMAPEVFQNKNYTEKADVYSYGT
jgi:serine/threonine protein kinase